jgi:ABC-type nitrate/sulfonate/bicarbonate transport system substrate-binding protein
MHVSLSGQLSPCAWKSIFVVVGTTTKPVGTLRKGGMPWNFPPVLALLAAAVLIVAACGPTAPAAPPATAVAPTSAPAATGAPTSPTSTPTILRVGAIRASLGAFPVFIAMGRGYFAKQGLDVRFVEVSSGAELLPLMGSGQLEAGVSSPAAGLYNAIANNVPLKAVLDMGRAEPGTWWGGIVVRPELLDSGVIKTPADLRGKTIAITGPGTATQLIAIRLLEANGLTEKDVNVVSMTFADMLSAFASKNIDAADLTEPTLTLGQEQGLVRPWVSDAEIDPGQQKGVMMITPGLAAKPDVADRFVLALVQAERDYRAAFGPQKKDQEAVIGAVLPLLGTNFTADILRKMAPLGLDPDGFVNGNSIKDQQDWYAAHGLVNKPVNIEAVVDNSFAERARATLATQR